MDTKSLEALADENRLAIVRLLSDGAERCACEISIALDLSGALTSHHLKRLREAGLVITRRTGVWLHCSLDAEAIRALAQQIAELAPEFDPTTRLEGPCGCCAPRTTKEDVVDV